MYETNFQFCSYLLNQIAKLSKIKTELIVLVTTWDFLYTLQNKMM